MGGIFGKRKKKSRPNGVRTRWGSEPTLSNSYNVDLRPSPRHSQPNPNYYASEPDLSSTSRPPPIKLTLPGQAPQSNLSPSSYENFDDSDHTWNSRIMVVEALYNYRSCYGDDIDFKMGDKLEAVDRGGDWWRAKHLKTRQEGYIPSNYVVQTGGPIETHQCYFKLDGREAEKQLLLPKNKVGTFMIRPNTDKGAYILSVLCEDKRGRLSVVHYQICKTQERFFYVDSADVSRKPFADVFELINHYKENSELQSLLMSACSKELSAIPLKEFEVKAQDIRLEEEIGKGHFATVYAATFRGVLPVAVKKLKASSSMTPEEFKREAEMMHRLRHPKLVVLMGVCVSSNPIYIITERLSNGSLLDYLREHGGDEEEIITLPLLLDMAIQVTDGMTYLEQSDVVHRDLRAANVLVGDNNVVKIADFGLAKLLDTYYEQDDFYMEEKSQTFPFKWTAPEAALRNRFSIRSDVWSFGVFLYELVTRGDEPYAGRGNAEVIEWVSEGNRLQVPNRYECPSQLCRLMDECWKKDPTKRPRFSAVKASLEGIEQTIQKR